MSTAIQIGRYVLVPLVGLLAGWSLMRWRRRKETSDDRMLSVRTKWVLLAMLAAGTVVMGGMVTLRYVTWHSFLFDLGGYDQKVWLISRESSWWGMWQQTYKGGVIHFQPWLLIPGLIYKVWDSPLVLLWLQVILVVSGVIPVFLLARDYLDSSTAGLLAGTLYLLYPAVQYNGLVDFRPDHLTIPTMLWAYFLAARGHYLASLGMAGLGSLSKETLILNGTFFGLYLAVRYGQRMMGAPVFILGIAAFCFVLFRLLVARISLGHIVSDFPALSDLASGTLHPVSIIQTITQTHKLLYLYALFIPLALLPLLGLPELIPAVPSLAISLLSLNPNHASIEAQYSASVVAPAFAAMLVAVAKLRRAVYPRVAPVPVLAGLVVLSAFVSFALAPGPLSLNFWNPVWGGRWHVTQYLPEHQQALDRAVQLVPADPKVVVVTQNDINSGRLAHRFQYLPLPEAIGRADYVLLDTSRQPYVYWMWDPQRYLTIVRNLLADRAYRIIFDRQGVMLFKLVRAPVQSSTP